jgi:ABC-type long-subunit fatty acid transport system fused permease/ATPase subunit
MNGKTYTFTGFSAGFISGAVGVLLIGAALLYMLNTTEVIAISALKIPGFQWAIGWAYENLRLSIIPFAMTFICFVASLLRLNRYLKDPKVSADQVAQTEHLVDIWINLFFGIGVIWTAIGMRGALLEGLGDLDSQSAAKLGAFSILQRLVDGGILLALSTTIFGAVGGYLLRLVKSLAVGARLKAYYNRLAEHQAESVQHVLQSIDDRLSQMVALSENDNGILKK